MPNEIEISKKLLQRLWYNALPLNLASGQELKTVIR